MTSLQEADIAQLAGALKEKESTLRKAKGSCDADVAQHTVSHATSIPILWCCDFSTSFTVKICDKSFPVFFLAKFNKRSELRASVVAPGKVREFLASEEHLSSRAKASQLWRSQKTRN